MKKKVVLIILSILFLIGIILSILFFSNNQEDKINDDKDNEITDNISKELTKDQIINNISFTNIKCSFQGNYYLLEYTITNQNNDRVNIGEYELIVKDKDNNIIANIAPYLDIELNPNESYSTGSAIDIDLTNASSMEFVISE